MSTPPSTPLQTALDLLPQMTRSERDELRRRILSFDQFTGNGAAISKVSEAGVDPYETVALSAIVDVLAAEGIEHTAVGLLRRPNNPMLPTFREKLPLVIKYFVACKPKRNELFVLLKLATLILHNHLRDDLNIAVSSQTLLGHYHRIPAVMNQAFPGLAQSGLLYKLLQPHTHGATDVRTQPSRASRTR